MQNRSQRFLIYTLTITLLSIAGLSVLSCQNVDGSAETAPTPTPTAAPVPEPSSSPAAAPLLEPTPSPSLDLSQFAPAITVDLTGLPVIGSKNSPITIVEFSDYECPFCSMFHKQTLPVLKERYIDKGLVNITFIDFPLTQLHSQAIPASNAAWCAHEQGVLEDYQVGLFESQNELNDETFAILAEELRIDIGQFEKCYADSRYDEQVTRNFEFGASIGIRSTPSFLILQGDRPFGNVIIGAQNAEEFSRVIDSALEDLGIDPDADILEYAQAIRPGNLFP